MIYIAIAAGALSFFSGVLLSLVLIKKRFNLIYNAGYQSGWLDGREDLVSYLDKSMGVEVHLDQDDNVVKNN
jgi:hypothetical protein